MIFGLLDWLKIGAGALAGAAIGFMIGYWQGHDAGYDKRVAEMAAATVRADMERRGDDAVLQSMSDYDLCVVGLRAGGLSVDACEQLRGLGEE